MPDVWVTLTAESAHYADRGRDVILCDRLPHPVTLVCRLNAEQMRALREEIAEPPKHA